MNYLISLKILNETSQNQHLNKVGGGALKFIVILKMNCWNKKMDNSQIYSPEKIFQWVNAKPVLFDHIEIWCKYSKSNKEEVTRKNDNIYLTNLSRLFGCFLYRK